LNQLGIFHHVLYYDVFQLQIDWLVDAHQLDVCI
jgi:hypothetical protein